MDKLVRKIEVPLARKIIEKAGLYIVQKKDFAPYGTTLTVPAAELATLASLETVTIRVARDNTFALLSGEEVLPLAETVLLEIPK